MGTVKAAITTALRKLVVLSEGEEASADMIDAGLVDLKSMIAQWSIEGLMVPYQTKETFTLDSSTASYTWGIGQSAPNFNSVAPTRVDAASFVLGNYQKPLLWADNRVFMQQPTIGNSGEPTYYNYDRQLLPRFVMDCPPYAGAVTILSRKAFTTEFDLTDELAFPPEYDIPIWSNLAILIAPAYDKDITAAVGTIASLTKKNVERYNAQPIPTLRVNVPSGQSRGSSLSLRAS